jgi:hypothetical protein
MVNQTGARALNGPDGGKDSSCRPWRQLGERNGVREQGAREVRFLLDADEYVWVQTSDENGKGKKFWFPSRIDFWQAARQVYRGPIEMIRALLLTWKIAALRILPILK